MQDLEELKKVIIYMSHGEVNHAAWDLIDRCESAEKELKELRDGKVVNEYGITQVIRDIHPSACNHVSTTCQTCHNQDHVFKIMVEINEDKP